MKKLRILLRTSRSIAISIEYPVLSAGDDTILRSV